MNLYILRHGIAVPRGTPGIKDENRPLTKDGKQKMKEVAKGMRSLKLKFDHIASSPWLRARESADIVAKAFQQEVEIWRPLASTEDPRQLIAALRKAEGEGVLLVGHEPHLSQFVSVLISGSPDSQIELKKGGLCMLTSDDLIFGQCATLHWLLAPAYLRKLA
jgi:phosphohistidine phosphatase